MHSRFFLSFSWQITLTLFNLHDSRRKEIKLSDFFVGQLTEIADEHKSNSFFIFHT